MKANVIGILGGMGPSASGYLYNMINRLAAKEYGAKRNQDFPETILFSVPVPDFISSSRNKKKALKMLKNRVNNMNLLPVKTIGIACNTAHILLPDLQNISKGKFISMIDAVVGHAAQKNVRSVGLLATSSTVKAGLYQKNFENIGVDVIVPEKKDQKHIDRIIKRIVSEQIEEVDRQLLKTITAKLIDVGAKNIVLGCTELPLLFPKNYPVPTINSVEVLAQALLRETML